MQHYVEFAQRNEARLFQDLEHVVNINSHTGNIPGCQVMLDWFEAHFREMGLREGGQVAGSPERNHLILTNGVEEGPHILLVGHVDTVFPKEHFFQTFEQRGECFHGPGVSDMKGGLLVAAGALGALQESGMLSRARVTAFINSDEETQSLSSKHLLLELCGEGADIALVFEGGRANGNLVKSRKGVGRYFIHVTGKAAHAGMNHDKGINAIEDLAAKVLAIQGLTDYDRGITLNVGKMEGGVGRNTVAPEASAEFDLRILHPEDEGVVDDAVRNIALEPHVCGTQSRLEGGLGRPPWPENEGSEELASHFIQSASGLGQNVGAQPTGGGSDGNYTYKAGIPTLDALGPVGGNPHTPEEYIVASSLAERVALTAYGIAEWIRVQETK